MLLIIHTLYKDKRAIHFYGSLYQSYTPFPTYTDKDNWFYVANITCVVFLFPQKILMFYIPDIDSIFIVKKILFLMFVYSNHIYHTLHEMECFLNTNHLICYQMCQNMWSFFIIFDIWFVEIYSAKVVGAVHKFFLV